MAVTKTDTKSCPEILPDDPIRTFVAPDDRELYAAATPEQRAKYHEDMVRLHTKLRRSEASGISTRTHEEIIAEAVKEARRRGYPE